MHTYNLLFKNIHVIYNNINIILYDNDLIYNYVMIITLLALIINFNFYLNNYLIKNNR